jgi:hypothetical protein
MRASACGRVRKYSGFGRARRPARPHASQQRSRVGRAGPRVEAADQSATTTSRTLRG